MGRKAVVDYEGIDTGAGAVDGGAALLGRDGGRISLLSD